MDVNRNSAALLKIAMDKYEFSPEAVASQILQADANRGLSLAHARRLVQRFTEAGSCDVIVAAALIELFTAWVERARDPLIEKLQEEERA